MCSVKEICGYMLRVGLLTWEGWDGVEVKDEGGRGKSHYSRFLEIKQFKYEFRANL